MNNLLKLISELDFRISESKKIIEDSNLLLSQNSETLEIASKIINS